MNNPWRVIGIAIVSSLLAVVVLNAQYFWLNLRYSVTPTSAAVNSQTPNNTITATPLKLPAIGITNADLFKIPLGLIGVNAGEQAQVVFRSLRGSYHSTPNIEFARRQRGKLFLQVESKGELWYVNPADSRRYYVPSMSVLGSIVDTLAGVTVANKAALTPPSVAEAIPANTLVISSLDVVVPVIYIDEVSEQAFQDGLAKGVVHYPGTARPGEYGNVYIFGHSSDYFWSTGNYKSVFAVLPRIAQGAEVKLSDSAGAVYTYRVFDQKVVSADDVSYLGQYDNKRPLLTLQTSWPIGTALKRYIVQAELVQ